MFVPSKTHSKPSKPIQKNCLNPANPFIGAITIKPSLPIHAEPKPTTASIHFATVNQRERTQATSPPSTRPIYNSSTWWLVMGFRSEERRKRAKLQRNNERERERERERELIQNSLIKSRRERELNKNIYVQNCSTVQF